MPLRLQARRLWAPLAVAAAALIVAFIVACNGGANDTTTPTPSPSTPSTNVSPIAGTATPTPLPPLEPTSYRFLYSEFGSEADVIWSINPAEPSDRVQLATLPHQAGSAVVPALSPDGTMVAYNAMPEAGVVSSTDAETRILDLESGETELVAEGVHLRTTPLWSPDGGLLFLRRDVGEEVTVILVDLREPEESEEDEPPPIRTVLRQHVSDVLVYTPLGFDAEEATLYFIQVQGGTESGSYLGRYAPATGEAVATATAIAEATATAVAGTPTVMPESTPTPSPALFGDVFLALTDQIGRDYSLSPDASRVAFLVPGLVEGQFVARTHIADIGAKQVSPLEPDALSSGDQVSPIWHPDGDKVSIGELPSGGNPGRVAMVALDGGEVTFLLPPERGFDQPLSWSPDGKFLAVSSFPGESLGNLGLPRLVFVSPTGQRPAAPEGAEFEPIGWVAEE